MRTKRKLSNQKKAPQSTKAAELTKAKTEDRDTPMVVTQSARKESEKYIVHENNTSKPVQTSGNNQSRPAGGFRSKLAQMTTLPPKPQEKPQEKPTSFLPDISGPSKERSNLHGHSIRVQSFL